MMTEEQQTHVEHKIKEHVSRCFQEGKPRWWQLNIAQFLTVFTVVIGGLYSLVQYQSRLANVEGLAQATLSRVVAIDSSGTQFSRQTTALDHQIIVAHEQRLQKLEDVGIKLAVIQSQLDQVSRDVIELKQRRNPSP